MIHLRGSQEDIDQKIEKLKELDLDSLIVSEMECPLPDETHETHYFRMLDKNVLCNCTKWLIVGVKLPIVFLRSAINIVIQVDLTKQKEKL